MKRLLVALIAMAMFATGTIGNGIHIQAAAEGNVVLAEDVNLVVTPGETTHVKIPITVVKEYILNPAITISAAAGAPFTFSKPTLHQGDLTVSAITTGSATSLEFDVKTKASATIKDYPISIVFNYHSYSNDEDTSCSISTNLSITDEKEPTQLTVSSVSLDNSKIGSKSNLSFTVTNEGELTAKNIYLVMDYGQIVEERYSATKIKVGDLSEGGTKQISLPITILSTATTGKKTWVANFTYKTLDGDEVKSTYNVNVNLSANESAPSLIVKNVDYKEGLKAGDNFTLSVDLKNNGMGTANSIKATLDASSVAQDGIIKNYYTDEITVSNIKKDKENTAEIPLTVSKYATGGMKNLKIVVTYKDDAGIAYTLTETIYVDIIGATTAGTPNIVISNVSQSPEQPLAGDKLEISFDLENKSKIAISELKVYADGLTNATFIPIKSEPYQYIEKLKAGEKVRITIPLIASTSITEGLNNLTIKYKYTGGEESSVIIPVHDVQNDLGSSSKPKLIISKYTTDVEELRAGSTFNFTYDIYNTNSSVAAKNITVTITQADNIFTVTQGSNSFFINKIEAGETVENTIELKVKSDATTKAYPLKITIDYEYEGMEPNPETGETGVTKTEELNLQAIENARPVADNIQVYSWDGNVMVGGTATLSFEFYNMGKSVLNNVVATVEGEGFTKADGSMYFIGNVEAGSSSLVEFDVIPNMEGTVPGTLKISYEDSNGDTVEFTKDFEGAVMGATTIDPGVIDDGSGEVLNPDVQTVKAAILPLWAFVILQVAIFILFVPITRKIIISAYRSKLRKKEQEQY
ncbi:MAG: hypothetical protein PHF63_08060 [Herbinix sp.]|nr:hypothetical protein [Herbinix sp.]